MSAGPPPGRVQDLQRQVLQRVLRLGEVDLDDVWLRYFAHGGSAGLDEVEDFLGGGPLPEAERDLLAHSANERLGQRLAASRVPLAQPVHVGRGAALQALSTLLEGTRRVVAGEIGAVAAEAGRALGVQVVVYLVDYQQRLLVPCDPPPRERRRGPLAVERTLPGRAFRWGRTQTALTGPRPRWWIPLVDGAETLGVLDVVPASRRALGDPRLRADCELLARLVAHLVGVADRHGDAVDAVRRSRRRTAAAELVWRLLPPLTADVGEVVVSGLVEPADDVGGDVFDHAVTHDAVHLAVFDAMGHSLRAGLIATAAVAAYRSARRGGADLPAQAAAIDEVVAEQFPDALVTGVLLRLDRADGTLRSVCAGHPPPLLLREGRVVGEVAGGRRTPFGLPPQAPVPGQEALQPGDRLALFTDGIVEARSAAGEFFGTERLADFLERAASTTFGLAETVRRLVQAVLEHQGGLLQDDATVLLAQWRGPGGAR
ncbi:PP2C family protein-serine/threonine phosphatase [Kineococcus sp. SYSU DK006]|uniref:PP2C family protein-serine/threonine phosphatase n=1 Tax=Kineococcus sp. SYSU DK006 TaxID=3383127 RepID=UPI003D7DC88A